MNIRQHLSEGHCIPALPLALNEDGKWSERHQRALVRYYIAAGSGGLAVGVHSTQFEIREPQHGLFEPVLALASEVMSDELGGRPFARIAGLCGKTEQASSEAAIALKHGYGAGLLSLAAWKGEPEAEIIEHCRTIAGMIPIVGFYLQPAVGGRVFSYKFWREFATIENVVAIKMAPFNRYQTWDVIRAVVDAGRDDIALYTGNDDNIIVDLLTPFKVATGSGFKTRFIIGGLLGQWGVWTERAVALLNEIKAARKEDRIDIDWLSKNAALTDMNAVVFDSANAFAGCIPGILEVLRRQGLVPSIRCLNPHEVLSAGQAAELDRVVTAYPEFVDDSFVARHLDSWLR